MKPAQPPTVFLIRELPVERSFDLAQELVRDAMAGAPGQSELEVDKPGEVGVDVEVTEEGGSVLARGTLRGWVYVACSRCLAPVKLSVAEPFLISFLPHETHADAETEVELNESDIDSATYTGESIDLAPIIRDHLVLAAPYAPLCREECAGLCARCGADLNAGPCGCPAREPDHRWAALKNLKLPQD